VWHPRTVEDWLAELESPPAEEAADPALRLGPRTVIWLDELQRYLLTADPRSGSELLPGCGICSPTAAGDRCWCWGRSGLTSTAGRR